jgi:hypothetical protein
VVSGSSLRTHSREYLKADSGGPALQSGPPKVPEDHRRHRQDWVDGNHLPNCLASLDPQVLSQQIIDWWKQNPKQAENPVVLAVAFALHALNPC